jgi:inner membrane protein
MDNLTHSLVGAVLGQMGLKRKTGLAMPTLIIAANIPDIDAVAVLLGGHQHLAIRRGITHGPIAMLLPPLLLWGAMLWFDAWQTRRGKRPEKRLPVHRGWLLGLAYVGCLTHPALDWCNSYGIRLLEPFSHRWFYGDILFIVDVWIWAALIAGVWVSLRRERREQGNWTRPAWIGFTAVCAYILANGLITGQAESKARDRIVARNDSTVSMPEPIIVANPALLAFWQRDILWRDGQDFGFGVYSLGTGPILMLEVRPHNMGAGGNSRKMPFRVVFDEGSDGAAYLFWSRMPVLEQKGQEFILRDQRFMDPRIGDRFTVRFSMPRATAKP